MDEELSFQVSVQPIEKGTGTWLKNEWLQSNGDGKLGVDCASPTASSARGSAASPMPVESCIVGDREEDFDAYEPSDASSLDSSLFGPTRKFSDT